MNKFIGLLCLALSLFTLPAAAGEIVLGATGFNATLTSEFTQDVAGTTSKAAATGETSQFGGGLYFGYIWNVNSGFDIAVEGFYDFLDVTSKASLFTDQPLKQEVNAIYGLRAMPGFKITNNTKIYIELGWAMVGQKLIDDNLPKSSSKDTSSGFRYGAGLQTMIYDNISLRLFYSMIDQLSSSKVDNVDYGKFEATPTVSEFGVGIAYHFKL